MLRGSSGIPHAPQAMPLRGPLDSFAGDVKQPGEATMSVTESYKTLEFAGAV